MTAVDEKDFIGDLAGGSGDLADALDGAKASP
jgi:hypothetical protein